MTTSDPIKDAIETLYKPIESILKTLAGPAAEEFGFALRDSVRMYRFKRQVRLFKQFEKICSDANIKPQSVKLPLLFDIIERASVEDDDELQDLWANLLVNAANPARKTMVSRAFPEILKQLSKQEAIFLSAAYETTGEQYRFVSLSSDDQQLPALQAVERDNLFRLGLIGGDTILVNGKGRGTWLTGYGYEFVKACRAPKKTCATLQVRDTDGRTDPENQQSRT